MAKQESVWVLGFMSGTSLDGIDIALIKTDGQVIQEFGPAMTLPYEDAFRQKLRALLGGDGQALEIEQQLTRRHAQAVERLLSESGFAKEDIALIGFHGQTILHDPANKFTWQIGDGQLLANLTGIPVVNDFRSADVAAGGQGAPFASLYHAALCHDLPKPVVVLNIGGVSNVTWIGDKADEILAFDTGPGNALLDDWMMCHMGQSCDKGGKFAAKGKVDKKRVEEFLKHPYFQVKPPKSLDRNDFSSLGLKGLSPEDGAATLTYFTAASIAKAQEHFPKPAKQWVVTGGGRHNPTLLKMIQELVQGKVVTTEDVSWDGDALEAQAFAYLAARHKAGLPTSLPTTTGIPKPICGGELSVPEIHHCHARSGRNPC